YEAIVSKIRVFMVYGQCLFEALDGIEVAPLDPNDPFTYHMPIMDKVKELGTVFMGKVESGSVHEDDNLLVMPNKVRVLAIYCDEARVRSAGPGENLRVRVSGIEVEDLRSGLCWMDALPEGVDIGNYVFAFEFLILLRWSLLSSNPLTILLPEEVNYTGLHPTLEWAQIEYDLVKYIGDSVRNIRGEADFFVSSEGELCLKGPAVMNGYLGNEAAMNATMVDGCMCAY
ncbi:eukaryotic peptide chain release factor GTP-binding subunit ERF3A isoform X1, partial [Tanacetum coccineum]